MIAAAKFREHIPRQDQNEHVRACIFKVADAYTWLTNKGFTILRVVVEDSKPVVWIQNCPRVTQLRGVWYRRERAHSGTSTTWQATVRGCRVQWISQ